jgi:hypothetical protein
MPKSHNTRAHPAGQQKASELQNASSHVHNAAEHASDPDRLKSHELTRLSEEHNPIPEASAQHAIHGFGHKEIAALAHQLWQARGCPEGSPDEDWDEAVKQLRRSNVQTHRAAGG